VADITMKYYAGSLGFWIFIRYSWKRFWGRRYG